MAPSRRSSRGAQGTALKTLASDVACRLLETAPLLLVTTMDAVEGFPAQFPAAPKWISPPLRKRMRRDFALSIGIAPDFAHAPRFARRCLLAALLVTELLVGIEAARSTSSEVVISQRDKQFQPGVVTVEAGQPVVIVNDDGGTVHHAYVESETFNFDSGDQNPGTKTQVVFPAKGDFQVLCGIHPKMKLDVHVR